MDLDDTRLKLDYSKEIEILQTEGCIRDKSLRNAMYLESLDSPTLSKWSKKPWNINAPKPVSVVCRSEITENDGACIL